MVLLFLLWSLQAQAKEKEFFFRCPSYEEAYASIFYCSENPKVVAMAEKCEADLRGEWNRAQKELLQILSIKQRPDYSRQKLEFQNTESDYAKMMKKIDHLVKVTDQNADVVATYSRAIVDRPDANAAMGDTSECFTEAKEKIQKVVNNLDQMIREGLVAKGEATGLKAVALDSDQRLENLTGEIVKSGAVEEVPVPERNGIRQSDISGIVPEEMVKGIGRVPASKKSDEKKKADYLWMDRLIDSTLIEEGKK